MFETNCLFKRFKFSCDLSSVGKEILVKTLIYKRTRIYVNELFAIIGKLDKGQL